MLFLVHRMDAHFCYWNLKIQNNWNIEIVTENNKQQLGIYPEFYEFLNSKFKITFGIGDTLMLVLPTKKPIVPLG